ncbi:MAG: signal recognition particle protein [Candidatus Spyradocola sp.]|nr:signal recognition particle protein [Candidatus Spyradocola sp.]
MAFENLADKLQAAFKKLNSRGKLTEKDVKDAMREVRMALLEADVNYLVVKDFVKRVTDRAVGEQIFGTLNAGQTVIKIVREEMTALMGGTNARLEFTGNPPTVIMLIGLQGAGKTTLAGKLAGMLQKQGKKPMLVAADVYRPAAIKQLQVVGSQVDVPVFEMGQDDPVGIVRAAKREAIRSLRDVMIVDTAGRLQIDDNLMQELENIKQEVAPQEILLVVDAMTGQEAVNVAKTFDERLGITGVVLTKLDGDTRGGAALSIRAVTGKPIKFSSIGEKLDQIEPFHPDRMASRILGMGDVLTLIDKASALVDEKKAADLEQKLRKNQFTLEDFLDQFAQMRKMGGMNDMLSMLPGGSKIAAEVDEDEMNKNMARTEAIILSMTPKERRDPRILNASRKRRIAAGSGTTVQQINQLLKQFEQTQAMVKQFGQMGKKGRKGMKMPFKF